MQRFRPFRAAVALLLGGPAALAAQEPQAAAGGSAHRRQHRRRGQFASHPVPDHRHRRSRRAAAGELSGHPARHHQSLPHRPVRRRPGGAADRGRQAGARAQGEGAPGAGALGRARHESGLRGIGEGPGQAGRGPAARPQRRGAVPRLDRFPVQARGLLRRADQDAGAASGRRPGPGRVRRERGQSGLHQPGRRRGQSPVFRQECGRSHDHQARGLLVVPEGRVRRGQAGAGRAREAPGLVRRPRLHGLPGDGRLARGGQHRGQGDPPPQGGRGPAVLGGDVRPRGESSVLGRGADGVVSVRPRGPERRLRGPPRVQPLAVGGGHREGGESLRQ